MQEPPDGTELGKELVKFTMSKITKKPLIDSFKKSYDKVLKVISLI